MNLGAPEESLLKRYPKAIAHMHWRNSVRRLGLVFGAGASRDLGFPTWETLVRRIARSSEVDGSDLVPKELRKPLPIIAESAFHLFRERHLPAVRKLSRNVNDIDRLLTARWVDLLHRCLYQGVPTTTPGLLKRDTVYKHLLPIVKRSPITVNYNYDDTLQRILLHDKPADAGRGFETVTDPNLPHSPSNAVLYHPNGFLPHNLMERTSQKIVFNEGTFAGQVSDFMMGTFSSMLNHLSQNTALFVGLSLSDETLRHMLHRSAILNPGHYHYYVAHCDSTARPPSPAMKAEAAANFETYNLITLFLDSSDIAALGHCLAAPEADLKRCAKENAVRLSYTFYLVGVPGVGKTTALSQFKDLATWDEWLDERLPEMGKPFPSLTDRERQKVDEWIMKQVGLKNTGLIEAEEKAGIGITIVDRCVPDAVTFTQPKGWKDKAQSLLEAISPKKANLKVYPGHVILLVGDAEEISIRAEIKNRKAKAKYIEGLQAALDTVYGSRGVTKLDVSRLTIREAVKEVARLIHLENYTTCNLQKRLEDIRDGRIRSGREIKVR